MLLAMGLAAYVRFGTLYPQVAFIEATREVFYPSLFPFLLIIWLAVFSFSHLYDFESLFWGAGEFSRVFNAITLGVVILVFGSFALKLHGISRGWMLLSWLLAIGTVSAGRLGFRKGVAALRRRGVIRSRTLIVGTNNEAKLLLARAERPASGLHPVGYVGYSGDRSHMGHLPCLGSYDEVASTVQENGIECVMIASSNAPHEEVTSMVQSLRGLPVDVHISSGLFDILTSRVLVREIGGVPMVTIRPIPLNKGAIRTKRAIDLLIAYSVLLLLSPVWLLLAALIKLTSPGPVLYKQERVGRDGQPFMMYKFRSMVADADKHKESLEHLNQADGLLFKIRNDPRVTKVGRLMRKFSVDEFPQLLNVIEGDMSLVGPRPPLPGEVAKYEEWHFRRLQVVPGMTGLWQISGRSDLSFDDAVKLDIYYIENWSPRLDFSILFRTIPVVLLPKGAY